MPPDPAPVLDLIEAFRRSATMFAATRLGLFDHLSGAPARVAELAARTGTQGDALTRLLEGCVALGLLRTEGGLFFNTPLAAKYLTSDSPDSLSGYILYSAGALYPMWGHLEDAVRENAPRWRQVFGGAGALFEHFYRTPESRARFLAGMHGLGRLSSPAVVGAFDLSRWKTLVDLGGATGHLAISACERYGALRATVFDLPEVLPYARPHIAASPAAGRITLCAGDFFADTLPPASLYALGRILHDWDDARCAALLARVHAALEDGGGILIAEKLLDDGRCGPVSGVMQSLHMLVCTEGRERSGPEFRALLEAAGFTGVRFRRTGAPLDAILAVRKQ